jgi:hypothetical protein
LVRRLNSAGDFCVVSRRGDRDAGQIWIEIDHLDGTCTLLAPAPSNPEATGREFVCRVAASPPADIQQRLALEVDYDPDFWVVSIETRKPDLGLNIVEF